jgi:hypothetical protein
MEVVIVDPIAQHQHSAVALRLWRFDLEHAAFREEIAQVSPMRVFAVD